MDTGHDPKKPESDKTEMALTTGCMAWTVVGGPILFVILAMQGGKIPDQSFGIVILLILAAVGIYTARVFWR